MKTVHEAILATQKKKVGFINQASVKYAETILQADEDVTAAVIANIKTKRDGFPGVVVITDQRVLAVCGLPGIKRLTSLPIDQLKYCQETASAIQYKVVFQTDQEAFSMTVDPDVGDNFTTFIARLNGEEFEAVKLNVSGNIFNPNMIARKQRTQNSKEKAKKRNIQKDIELQKQTLQQFEDL